ncbi:hypothetical protein Dthio_PD1314 [Desulfonatronospira thiodismutans ASO3-1]|uniref:PLAT domain-containing protein n=1 Tax=Desulfonatronospira thiodismutans ASO3-1 TaxID=555779 RepID=D6STF9_9BACT|nr:MULTISPECIES: hypothetical protein [Desulfonatronospira]EFI33975.1 hypothetical protein Dthio_PD1314 [Desulfonatronospira thiodismutans ASO3-1]RQD74999.1 MAG: hypothetical protein D5S03_09200 [Desulfonatronospira sp. MSAO_Bac3]
MSKKYSVILMRDDTSVRKFRIRPFWIKFFIALFFLAVTAAALGGYFTITFYQEKRHVREDLQVVSKNLEQTAEELEKKRNIQKIFETYESQDLHSFLTVNDTRRNIVPPVDLVEVFEYKDRGIVGVDNVQAGFNGDRMRVRLDVNNMAEGETISGRIFLHLVRRDGQQVDLDLDHDDLDYAISRFKNVDVTFELPEELSPESIFALRVKARDDDRRLLYSETFPLSQIQVS